MTGIGPVPVKVPRVRDRGDGPEKIRFTSSILPPYLRKAKSVEELLPWLYLKGISTGDFQEALAALLGPDAAGLSPSTISRLKADWWEEYEGWQRRDLSARRFIYIWADGRRLINPSPTFGHNSFVCPRGVSSDKSLELGECHLDRVQIGAVWRQEQKPCANGVHGLRGPRAFVR